jgi:hypothetical protein
MAQVRSKGTLLKLSIASTLTTVAQMIENSPPSWKSTDYESKTFDQSGAGVGRDLDGYADGGEFSATFWWDPALATHAAILALITTPTKGTWETLLTGSTPNKIDFTSAGIQLSPKLDMGKALQAEVKGNLDGLPVLS